MKSTKACYFCAISVFLLLKLCAFVFVFAMFVGNVKKVISSAFRPSCYPSVFVVVFVFVFAMLVGNVRKVLSVFRPSCYPSVFGGKGPGRCRCRSLGYFSDDMRVFFTNWLKTCQISLFCQLTRVFYQSVGESVKLCPILLVCQFGESLWIVWQQPKDMSLGSLVLVGLPMNLEWWWCWWWC